MTRKHQTNVFAVLKRERDSVERETGAQFGCRARVDL